MRLRRVWRNIKKALNKKQAEWDIPIPSLKEQNEGGNA